MSTSWLSFAGVVGILSATLATSAFTERRHPQALARPLSEIPLKLAGWTLTQRSPIPPSTLDRLVLSDYVSRDYGKNGQPLNLFIAYYAEQRSGESMHSPKHCLPGSGWEIWQYGSVDVPLPGRSVAVNKYSIHKGSERQVVLYWYQSGSRVIASEYVGKFLLMRDAVFDGRTDGALVRIILPDRPGAVEEGVAFASQLIQEVQRCYGVANLAAAL
jgi:EpsI family protein